MNINAGEKEAGAGIKKPLTLELLFDEPAIGQNQYGTYYLYAIKNGNGSEYSFFAPDEVHEQFKNLRKGDRVTINKTAEQKGTKVITKYDITPTVKEPEITSNNESYYNAMLVSYEDALKIQQKLNGLCDVNRIAITLFIARNRPGGLQINGN